MKTRAKLWMAGACLVLGGCSAPAQQPPVTVTVTPPSSASVSLSFTAPEPQAVAWISGLCSAVHGYWQASNEAAKANGSGVTVTKRWLSDELGRFAGVAGKAVDELAALPASPLPLGDTAKQSFVDKFTAARDIATAGKKKLDTAKGSSAALAAGVKAMQDAWNAVTDAVDPLAPLKPETSAEVMSAAASATTCQPPF